MNSRLLLRRAALDTSPPIDGVEERRDVTPAAPLTLPPEGDAAKHSSYDRRRDDFMRAQGYSILRLWNHDVVKHRTSVCEANLAGLDDRLAESVAVSDLRFAFTPHSLESVSSRTDLSS
ncbi:MULTISPECIES: DUF559 domain-containing protein [unclassified Mesorhizobium]|uniref:DUF559 domain-containing protein n=1 Tax=unclassified Mesorhizobium TaxID=325217 RepID=UPI000BAF0C55|nr:MULTISPECIES: DUF559 domain-containing protein [unclassified Mesorhizobium]TGT59722.1 DUF559 domain-containing protein [Mesorhizobium sp. M00.F.Ca.ET.170.01.1.1]AZO13198.1 DUF559 domain-containing protein [Mesorhizobium sp. M3A.F.Ca.ET.080.04.2.1]PBB86063.1 hypothetical protein CK216_14930 [Mesorhizobium sp. WSM3876]RWB69489.1 MAG: DUF559 domain-containing protein [Mesorhizobium sp.]RWB85972.1 MAG: DUF559 domain-containing protein [Mesorhizobium sp.]